MTMKNKPSRIICPDCGTRTMRVIDTRSANSGRSDNLTMRRRECRACGRRENYVEMPKDTFEALLDVYYMTTRHTPVKDDAVEVWIKERGEKGRNKKGWVKYE